MPDSKFNSKAADMKNRSSFLVLLLAPITCFADDALVGALTNCRNLGDDRARLSCYDAISPAKSRATNPGSPPAAASSVDAPADFGFDHRVKPAAAAVSSSIVGPFRGWESRSRLRLSNGQVWEISDGSRAAYWSNNPKVRIARGLFGSYFMKIEGVSIQPKVRRVE